MWLKGVREAMVVGSGRNLLDRRTDQAIVVVFVFVIIMRRP
jgi:hypothetical protein